MVGTSVRGVGVHHGVTFNVDSAKLCSSAIFETCFSYKDIWIAITVYYMYFCKIILLPLKPILQLVNFIYIHFRSLRPYFSILKHYLDLDVTDTALKVSQSLYCFTASICYGVENYFPRLWGTGI